MNSLVDDDSENVVMLVLISTTGFSGSKLGKVANVNSGKSASFFGNRSTEARL